MALNKVSNAFKIWSLIYKTDSLCTSGFSNYQPLLTFNCFTELLLNTILRRIIEQIKDEHCPVVWCLPHFSVYLVIRVSGNNHQSNT